MLEVLLWKKTHGCTSSTEKSSHVEIFVVVEKVEAIGPCVSKLGQFLSRLPCLRALWCQAVATKADMRQGFVDFQSLCDSLAEATDAPNRTKVLQSKWGQVSVICHQFGDDVLR